jgi:Uncharacterized protein conserved in bacteria
MNSLIRKSITPFGVLIVAVLFLIVTAIITISGVTHADNGSDPQRGRLITIYDRGTEKVILSQAATIGDALKEAGIAIDSKDAVEPAITEKLVASDYQVNIYRARPVIIIDGNTRTKIVTPYQTAIQIAQSAGIKLYDEDTTTIERTDDIIAEGAGLKLTINRATPFVFTLYGKTTTVRTQGTTVGEMLSEKSIKLYKDDRVSLSQDTKLTEGLAVRVWREGKQTITVDEPVEFEIEKIQDVDREVGYLQVRTPGEKGARNVTYEVLIQDGQEVSRTEIASITTKQPKKQVELVGIKPILVPYTGSGTKTEWMLAAGVAESDWGYVDFIISHESNWNPNSVNAFSGACGLAQSLPCSKVSGNPLDPIDSLRWANGYAQTRYSSWWGAYEFWIANRYW